MPRPPLTALAPAALAILLLTAPAAAQGGPPAALVKTAPVLERQVETKLTFAGTAEPHRRLSLASEVESLVARGEVDEGDVVARGQALITLDQKRIKLKADEARAQLAEAQSILQQMERDLARKKTLHKTKAVPLKDLEDAATAVERQKALVARSRAAVELLQADLADTRIRAPRSGVVVRRNVYQGEWVKKGGEVLVLSVLDPIKVVVQVPERHLPALKAGQEVGLTADALPGRELAGVIAAVIPAGDVKSRAFPVQIRMQNPDMAIKPGMLIRATLAVGRPHSALLVPKEALVISQTGYTIYLVMDGRAAPVSVKVVAFHDDLAEVTGRLEPGQQVVTTGSERLMPGQPVKVAGAPTPAGQAPSPAVKPE